MTDFMERLKAFTDEQPFNVIRYSQCTDNGEIETYEAMTANRSQDTYSVAKTFVMTAVGLLYDRKLIDLDEKICDILADEIPESGMDERWKSSTVRMALAHRLGLPWGFLDIDCVPAGNFTEDFLRYMLTYPLEYTPDTECRYSDGAYYLLARIVEKKCGMPADMFLQNELISGMDFAEIAWSRCPKGHIIGATGLYIHSSDMVKLGMLYLNKGIYNGKRLLSEEWCRLAVDNSYGWDWDETHRIYFKGGMFGQKLIVAPEQNRVVAMQANDADSDVIAKWVRDFES